MNASRIAKLLRELADAFEEGDRAPVAERKPVRRERRKITDIDKARARRSLRRLGIES